MQDWSNQALPVRDGRPGRTMTSYFKVAGHQMNDHGMLRSGPRTRSRARGAADGESNRAGSDRKFSQKVQERENLHIIVTHAPRPEEDDDLPF